jgi:hypothetical protein
VSDDTSAASVPEDIPPFGYVDTAVLVARHHYFPRYCADGALYLRA